MKFKIFIYLIFFNTIFAKTQNINNGIYINKKRNEFFYLSNDTVFYRLNALGCFRSYYIGKGKYEINKKGIYTFYLDNSIWEQISKITKYKRNDSSIVIKAFYKDSTPVSFAYLGIYNLKKPKKKKYIFLGITDKKGTYIFNSEQLKKYSDQELLLDVGTIGFSSKKKIILEKGYDYVIFSKIPKQFSTIIIPQKTKFSIKKINEREIKIEILGSGKRRIDKKNISTILTKVDIKIQYNEFLFDKDVKYFLEKN